MPKTIHHNEDNTKSFFGEEDHLEAAQSRSFSDMIFELLSGDKPTPEQAKLFELILNLSIDHGPDTPSAVATIAAATEGKTISESIAVGVLQINDVHGGAIEPAMELFYKIRDERQGGCDLGHYLRELAEEYRDQKKRIPGFGHRIYKVDPRAQLIMSKLVELKIGREFPKITKVLAGTLQGVTGKDLPLNVDGAIAAALCSFGWPARLGKAVFIIARVPGLCGQFLNTHLTQDSKD